MNLLPFKLKMRKFANQSVDSRISMDSIELKSKKTSWTSRYVGVFSRSMLVIWNHWVCVKANVCVIFKIPTSLWLASNCVVFSGNVLGSRCKCLPLQFTEFIGVSVMWSASNRIYETSHVQRFNSVLLAHALLKYWNNRFIMLYI